MPVAVVVPVRSFRAGKARLATMLDDDARAALGRRLAERVLTAAGDLACYVVTGDPEVAEWATNHGAVVVADPHSGLDGAAAAGRRAAAEVGATQVIVAHADLALAADLAWVADFDGVTIVTDRHGQGTNVIALPARGEFAFAYGDGSRGRHEASALAAGLAWRVVHDDALGWDIDEPADLADLPGDVRDLLDRDMNPDAQQRRHEAAAACEPMDD